MNSHGYSTDNSDQVSQSDKRRRIEVRTENSRDELAEQEGQLINALLGLAPAPPEVDSKQVEICGLSLKRKRARTLARFKGDQGTNCSIEPEMERYFNKHPGVHPGGPHADFRQYQQFLSRAIFSRLIKWIQKRLDKS